MAVSTPGLGSGELYIGSGILGTDAQPYLGGGGLFDGIEYLPNGAISVTTKDFFIGDGNTVSQETTTYYQTSTSSSNLLTALQAADPASAPTGTYSDNLLPVIGVYALASSANASGQAADTSPVVPGGLVEDTGDSQVSLGWAAGIPLASQTSLNNIANLAGEYDNSEASIVTGGLEPGVNSLLSYQEDTANVVQGYDLSPAPTASSVLYGNLADASLDSNSFTAIDPLLLDMTGNGIQVSNWIDNTVYFETNLNAGGTGVDPHLHHTSWTLPGTGMLVFDPTGGAITNITQVVSEDLNVGYGIGVAPPASAGGPDTAFSDSLAALANLAVAGATAFSAATSLTDPLTHQLYWNELELWQDANDNGVVDSGELQSLSQLGITSINLQYGINDKPLANNLWAC